LTGFLNHLRRARTLLPDNVTHSVNDNLIDGEKFAEHLCTAQSNAYDAKAHDVARFEPDADHCSLLRTTNLGHLFFRRKAACDIRCTQSDACQAGGFEQVASR
jgi:hypothetical protein